MVIKTVKRPFSKNLKLLSACATFVGVITLGLGVFTAFYYFNLIHNLPNPYSTSGVCYLIGSFILIAAGSRLIWRNVPTTFQHKHISVESSAPEYGTGLNDDTVR